MDRLERAKSRFKSPNIGDKQNQFRTPFAKKSASNTMSGEADHYRVLGLSTDASASDIKKAYRKLALKYHPDKQKQASEEDRDSANATFSKIAAAYEILSDEDERYQYDMRRKHGGAPGTRYSTKDPSVSTSNRPCSKQNWSSAPSRSGGTDVPSSFQFSYDPSKVRSRDPEAIFREVFGKDFKDVYPDSSMMGSSPMSPATPSKPRTKFKKKGTKIGSPGLATPTKSTTTQGRSPASQRTPTRIKTKAGSLQDSNDILSMSSSTKTVVHADGSHEVITETTVVRKDGSKHTSRESNRSTPSKVRRQAQKMPQHSAAYVKAL